ncbi:hypothetical protein [Jannaschia seohaensis]|uniref:Uncharacterized protein n=1 Tax=Jannaschia seohaensis TaxID=475081 RepID=A0A2Y9B8M3_9RHOB|nr:hypothetical protein [Jannaschia seohaensis]PWJ13243.1 hypothetical protein BCF38_1145 [Jannaschia seohaensis]SSA50569.1 hypothetical protein SAMN05421539_1145 [Jannaschia seohaensis]
MTNSYGLGTGLWGPPPEKAAEQFFSYSKEIDLDETLAQVDRVHAACRAVIPNAQSGVAYLKEIQEKADKGEPGSYIRLGDADGNVLFSSLGIYPDLARYNLAKISSIYFGNKDLMVDKLETFTRIVVEACEAADGIGAPERNSVEKSFSGYGETYDVRGKCGFRGVYNYFGQGYDLTRLSQASWTSTWVSRSLLPHYFTLLADRPHVGFITCYEELAGLMKARCNIGAVTEHLTPMQASIAHQTKRRRGLDGDIGHYPEVYEKICEEIAPPAPGTIYIVAAGILSKSYCTLIKQRGGIAIDVGSIADIWMNVKSRPGMEDKQVNEWSLVQPSEQGS